MEHERKSKTSRTVGQALALSARNSHPGSCLP
nr:MAG TPA: hypothetical protein [Caudoviricetes sp.]